MSFNLKRLNQNAALRAADVYTSCWLPAVSQSREDHAFPPLVYEGSQEGRASSRVTDGGQPGQEPQAPIWVGEGKERGLLPQLPLQLQSQHQLEVTATAVYVSCVPRTTKLVHL